MKNKFIIGVFVLLLFLIIGYAGYITDLNLNANVTLSTNYNDYQVTFTSAIIDDEDILKDKRIANNNNLEFTLGKFKNSGDTHTLNYRVTNDATMYDAKVVVKCNLLNDTSMTLTNSLSDVLIEAKTSKDGTVTLTLSEDISTEAQVNCSASTIPQERDELAGVVAEPLIDTLNKVYKNQNPSSKILLKTKESGNDIYYYTGLAPNNDAIFGGYCYKIVRTTSNGDFKLIYNGIPTDKTCNNTKELSIIKKSKYNKEGVISADYSLLVDGLQTNSAIKKEIDSWYLDYLDKEGVKSYLTNPGYCNDRSTYLDGEITKFNSYTRFTSNKPSLECRYDDLYTTSESTSGNKLLKYKIGLLTLDEVLLAGTNSYLNSLIPYWTMTPGRCTDSICEVFAVNDLGELISVDVTNELGIRPVITVKSDIQKIKGLGTINNPYILS